MNASNTVVTASDRAYIWGVYLLICSMRKNRMYEPVVVLGSNYSHENCQALMSLGDVKIEVAKTTERSQACSKPEVMFLAETDYITWCDSDGFFIGNCSEKLIYKEEDIIHIRKRDLKENGGPTPECVLSVWRRDVGERKNNLINTRCSTCFLSINKKQLSFIKKWDLQMKKILPIGDKGVVDSKLGAYSQTDESVLNSLLCFSMDAPTVAPDYKLNKIDSGSYFVHFVGVPKPWVFWTPHAFRFFDEYTSLIDWAKSNGKIFPSSIPFSLRSDKKKINLIFSKFSFIIKNIRAVRKRVNI
jgi:hypothetical protein